MTARMLAVRHYVVRPRNTKAVGEPVGKGEVFLVGSRPHLFGLHLLKRRHEILLIRFVQRPVCRRKQAVILFLDVLPRRSRM